MGAIHDEKAFAVKLRESADDGSDFSNPDADYRIVFLGEDGALHAKDSAGSVTDLSTGAPVPWAIIPYYGAAGHEGTTMGAANRAIYIPCIVPATCTITGIRYNATVSSGNICVGLYDSAGNRVATSGAVASPGTSFRDVNFAAPYVAAAGRYYLGISADNNTFAVNAIATGGGGAASNLFQDTAHPLPATIASGGTTGRQLAIIGRVSGGTP